MSIRRKREAEKRLTKAEAARRAKSKRSSKNNPNKIKGTSFYYSEYDKGKREAKGKQKVAKSKRIKLVLPSRKKKGKKE